MLTFNKWLERNGMVTYEEYKERMLEDGFNMSYIDEQWESIKDTYRDYVESQL